MAIQYNLTNRAELVQTITFKNTEAIENIKNIVFFTEDGLTGEFLRKKYRYSFDNEIWSLWQDLTHNNLAKLNFNDQPNFYIEVQYERTGIGAGNINNFIINYTSTSTPQSSTPCIDACKLGGEDPLYYLNRDNFYGNDASTSYQSSNIDASGIGVYYNTIVDASGTIFNFKTIKDSSTITVAESSIGEIFLEAGPLETRIDNLDVDVSILEVNVDIIDVSVTVLESSVTNLEENQVTGVVVYSTYTELPQPGTLLVSYKVANDPSNGYYHWSGSDYIKDANLANGIIEEGNIDAASGGTVYDELVTIIDNVSTNTYDISTNTVDISTNTVDISTLEYSKTNYYTISSILNKWLISVVINGQLDTKNYYFTTVRKTATTIAILISQKDLDGSNFLQAALYDGPILSSGEYHISEINSSGITADITCVPDNLGEVDITDHIQIFYSHILTITKSLEDGKVDKVVGKELHYPIVDDVVTGGSENPLSAKQGKFLNGGLEKPLADITANPLTPNMQISTDGTGVLTGASYDNVTDPSIIDEGYERKFTTVGTTFNQFLDDADFLSSELQYQKLRITLKSDGSINLSEVNSLFQIRNINNVNINIPFVFISTTSAGLDIYETDSSIIEFSDNENEIQLAYYQFKTDGTYIEIYNIDLYIEDEFIDYYDLPRNLPISKTTNDDWNESEKSFSKIADFKEVYKNKIGDDYNCVNAFFNGDSIFGSQLSWNTDSSEASNGSFPQNMRKNIIPRLFLDEYQYDDADVIYRNLDHADWTTSLATLNDGANFNHQQNYAIASGGYAQITVTAYSFCKICYSGQNGQNYSFGVTVSEDGGGFVTPSSLGIGVNTLEPTTSQVLMSEYEMYTLDDTKEYDFKIEPISGYANGLLFGCEMWNNVRLHVVVNAFSGSIARFNVANKLDGWYSAKYQPRIIFADMFAINDQSYIDSVGEPDTYDSYMKDINEVYNQAKENEIPIALCIPHSTSNSTQFNTYMIGRGICYRRLMPIIDIYRMQREKGLITGDFVGSDGLHLKDSGVKLYFDEIKKIMVEQDYYSQ